MGDVGRIQDVKKNTIAMSTSTSTTTPSSSSTPPSVKYPRPSWFKVWAHAARPHTLTASIAPVIVGHAITVSTLLLPTEHHASFSTLHLPSITLAWAAFACLIQLGTNLHNDYADFVKGADDEHRVGQPRATQKGWLTPSQTAYASAFCVSLALAIGYPLCIVPSTTSTVSESNIDGLFLFIILSSAFNAVAYTGGPYPLGYIGLEHVSIGYSGLGDLFVLLYFGFVATIGLPYLVVMHAGLMGVEEEHDVLSSSTTVSLFFGNGGEEGILFLSFLASIPVGFLATAIIVVNNLRDRTTDVKAGKRTMAVRFGERFARCEYGLLVLFSYASLLMACFTYFTEDVYQMSRYWILLPIISFPIAMPQLRAVAFGGKDGAALNDHVGGTAKVQFLFCILLSIGLRKVYSGAITATTTTNI
uniref:1,4-dihydroxy-2-naphthoate octaprenyltransferase n=1 Tax=Ditylum brightwellii TaxID=49249 RepID=A0A7S1YYD9_9STRA|mmetsp:Transcript_20258/g.30125  ORF Transcript_20258/g.30125 Transcript_20258/m.30125 type:complete len:417 (+) Transcript_20258:13-1263(+)